MSDDDDFDYGLTNKSSNNLATVFHGGPPTTAAATAASVPQKQPKKDSAPRVMIATVAQTFSFGTDQKWTPKGKMGIALLSTDNTNFQLIIYLSKTQQITSARITTTSVFTPQSNNYLSFQDDSAQNWSIMFETKQGIVDFALQIVLAKAYLLAFKFDHIIQDIREGEGSNLADHDTVEVSMNTYQLTENGTLQANDSGEVKPVKYKIGKNQNGKGFDDVLRGMKKTGQRVAIVGITAYSIEVTRIKREKEARSSSITTPSEEQLSIEQKRAVIDEHENEKKDKMLERVKRMGGASMIHHGNQPSAFVNPHQPNFSDDDSINNEYIQSTNSARSISTPIPPVQFVPPGYHHPQPLIQQANLYAQQQQQQQQALYDYNLRPGPSMPGMSPYQQASMWPPTQYPPTTPNIPPADMYYSQQPQQAPLPPAFQPDVRQLLTRLNEKVDGLNDKFDAKNSTTYPNMETSILLANIQRIVKENETVKKDLFDRSAKVEELNSKISELLDRNQQLIEKSHQTAEYRNVAVNNVSEQTAQKILELEKQKVELTTNLSISTSKISELQLQLNQITQDTNENQSRLNSLTNKCEQYKEELHKSESQRLEIFTKYETIEEKYKNEKLSKKQLQNNFITLEEELAELKVTCANFDKVTNDRKNKHENERKRWQDEFEEQKQTYEKELEELRTKLRKQRTTDNLTNNQELSRIEQDLEKEWREKLEKLEKQHERSLNSKLKEIEQLKASLEENETKLSQTTSELDESKEKVEAYAERWEQIQERVTLMREKIAEMNDEQQQLINDQVKQTINIIFQRLKARIQPTKQYTGEQFLSRSLEIIKKATLKVLLNNEDEDEDEDEDEPSDDDDDVQAEKENEKNDQPINGNSVDQQTLNEEVQSIHTDERNSLESETSSTINTQKNGWDIVEDLPHTTETTTVTEQLTTGNQNETTNSVIENNESAPSSEIVKEEEHNSDGSGDTVEVNDEKPQPVEEKPKEKALSDDDEDPLFTSARPSLITQSSAVPRYKSAALLKNPDDSDDEIFK